MKAETLEKQFQNHPNLKVYTIRSDQSEFITGYIDEMTRRNKILHVILSPLVYFDLYRGWTNELSMLKIEIEDNTHFNLRYGTVTTNYDTHKRQAVPIARKAKKEVYLQWRLKKNDKNFAKYLKAAKKL